MFHNTVHLLKLVPLIQNAEISLYNMCEEESLMLNSLNSMLVPSQQSLKIIYMTSIMGEETLTTYVFIHIDRLIT